MNPNRQVQRSAYIHVRSVTRHAALACTWVALAPEAALAQSELLSDSTDRAIGKAVALLAQEVPSWRPENGCFSCHNNGDGARALLAARVHGFDIPPAALAESVNWLRRPAVWQRQTGDQPFKDGRLAAVQFAAAQTAALNAGEDVSGRAHRAACHLLAELQQDDGSWRLDGGGLVGSPAGYGSMLATSMARRSLARASERQVFRESIAAADMWICAQRPANVAGAAAVMLGLSRDESVAADECRSHCLRLLTEGQHSSGGWGPFANAAPEPFDTALTLLALSDLPKSTDVKMMRTRGREYLIETQLDDGGWQETTRPAGAESYAQRISTTAWATLALLASREAIASK